MIGGWSSVEYWAMPRPVLIEAFKGRSLGVRAKLDSDDISMVAACAIRSDGYHHSHFRSSPPVLHHELPAIAQCTNEERIPVTPQHAPT